MSKQTAIRGNERVSIYDVDSGLNNNRLICECCGESLIAKKGDIKRHHFAHKPNSECVYNKTNTNGPGGVGLAHINAQNNFCKCYNDDKISMRIKYHPKCISGSMCRTWIEFDLKKRFPPNEYCMELEYYYKSNDNIYRFDIAILQKNNITAPPVYNIEILDAHVTNETNRMNIEWVEISAKQVNDQICDSRIKPILFYECQRNNNIVENKCDKCVQYTEYQRKKYEREQEIWEQTQREWEQTQREKEKRQQEKEEQEQREKEKQEQEQREKEKRQQERWEEEQRERKKKEQEKREQEQRDKEQRDKEKREQEQLEREKKEQELNKWSEQVMKQMHQRKEKEKREQEKCRQQRQNIEILSNQLFERSPELFKTKDSPQLIGKYEKIAKKEIKSCAGCSKSKRCLTCNLQITRRSTELRLSDLLKISE